LVLYSTAFIRDWETPDAAEVAWEQEGLEASQPGEGVGNFVFVSHTKKPVRAGGRYGGEQGRRNRG
jgi:hypothetical protein